uniref:BTB domain-containing protein n=1 Tax=Anopheles melas TaxID=34690 RepID=A0A182TTC2_9DIPT
MSSTEIEQTAVLVAQLAQLCLNADNADVTFIVKGQHLPAHRIILATRSEYFRVLLFGALKESKQNEITLDVSVDAFRYLMKYIYTGSLSLKEMTIGDILDTLELAHQYGFIDLQKAIANHLGKVIGMNNVCVILETARLLDLTELCSTCYTFMDENANSIIQSYKFRSISYEALFGLLQRETFAADEVDIFNAVHDWYRFNEVKPCKAEKLYNMVRFTLMSQHDLLNVVRSANVLSPNRLLDILAEKEKLTVLPYRGVSCCKHKL